MASRFPVLRAVMLWVLLASPVPAQRHEHPASTNEKLGIVRFSTS